MKRTLAAAELLLICPAALFFSAIFVRALQPQGAEPARTAARLVDWYVSLGPRVGLWGMLILLPLTVLVLGGATLATSWQSDTRLRQAAHDGLALLRTHLSIIIVAAATLISALVLAFVALHVITD